MLSGEDGIGRISRRFSSGGNEALRLLFENIEEIWSRHLAAKLKLYQVRKLQPTPATQGTRSMDVVQNVAC
jgi:hypothetical protein